MPSLNEMIDAGKNITGIRAESPGLPPNTQQLPATNGFIRCPIPPVFSSNPDSQRQFYVSGQVPQIRFYAPSIKTG